MESIGAKLRQARKEKNLTLEEVYQKTKIHLNTLKALEEDNFKNIGISYARGFLKMYAKFLGLDLNEVMGLYTKKFPSQTPSSNRKQTAPQPKPEVKLGKSFSWMAIKVFAILLVVIIVFGLLIFGLSKLKKKARTKPQEKLTFATTNAKSRKSTSGISQKKAEKINLVLRAKDDTWVQVSVDSHIVFRNVLKRGQIETWTAKEKCELSVGNAGGLDLEVNGKLISPLGRRGQVIKHIQITREYINIPR